MILRSTAFLALLTSTAWAVPAHIPVQGVLTDEAGQPIDERLDVTFTLYADAAGEQPLWSTETPVDFELGHFTTQLGATEPLDLALFSDSPAVWLGVAIAGDDEMALIEIGTAPFAAAAAHADHAADADTLGGRPADDFAAAVHDHQWADLLGIPADLADGDNDTTYRAGSGLELVDGAFGLLSGCQPGQILKRGAAGWACSLDSVGDADAARISVVGLEGTVLRLVEGEVEHSLDLAPLIFDDSASNELVEGVALEGTTLVITDAGGAHRLDLAGLVALVDDDADPTNELQTLELDGTDLTLVGGNVVSLADFLDNTDAQRLALNGNDLAISNGNAVSLALYLDNTDEQSLAFDGANLSISNGNSVGLGALLDNTDEQSLALNGTDLAISNGNAVSLAAFLDNTDAQTLSLAANVLAITGGNNVSLAAYLDNTDAQELGLAGTDLAISGGNSISLAALLDNTDEQSLAFDGANLSISNGNSVGLGALLDNTDEQSLALDGTDLAITNGNAVSLAAFLDNTDAQTLSLAANVLAITGGNNVSLAAYLDNTDAQTLSLAANVLAITGGNNVSLAAYLDNTDAQTLALANNSLSITGGNNVSLAAYLDNTDAQTLALAGTALSITGGNSVDLASLADDLGDHVATMNLTLGDFWISNDGDEEGLRVDSDGNVGIGVASPIALLHVGGAAHLDGDLTGAANANRTELHISQTSVGRVYLPNANTPLWQSFTVTEAGLLTAFTMHFDSTGLAAGELLVYRGEGTGGTLVLTQTDIVVATGAQTITLDTPVSVTAGEVMTVRVTDTGGAWRWRYNQADVYAGGRGSQSANEDFYLKVFLAPTPTLAGVTDDGVIELGDGAISIATDGTVGIGVDAPGAAFQVGSDGDGTAALANAWNTFSDARLKTDIQPIEDPLEKVMNLGGYTYHWKKGGERQVGVLAQEVQAVLPELVHADSRGVLTVAYGPLAAVLIEAVKSQQATIEDLSTENSRLAAQVARLNARVAAQDEALAEIRAHLGLPGLKAPSAE
ncbi:MAG: tail fiber domain-containing protein [bacterium]